jgi:hypothetical protein
MTQNEFDHSEALTDEQRESMKNLQERSGIPWEDFLERSALPAGIFPYVGVNDFHGMFVGIEPDGHTHT